ncbi:hypothetical protein [Halalkalibacter alkaliphilus]|uniref:Uncharacterized protein n=1 Tax=Halalkalibacter alkaliphilus TaxID=2917993 RepID=A0A9X2CT23_9BACI|nr:hypothetical protein [Halalkalibacter alkaliphilus]MCL7747721.1 hypothetical protein [Halalkalibacter alkaliphilus]
MVNIKDLLKNADYSTYEHKYSVQIIERIQEKKLELQKIVDEIEKIIIANRKFLSGDADYCLNEIITEKKVNMNRLLNVLVEGLDDAPTIIEMGTKIVKMIGVQNTLFTKLQLMMTQESFICSVTQEHITTLKYLIEYGRSLLLEVVK